MKTWIVVIKGGFWGEIPISTTRCRTKHNISDALLQQTSDDGLTGVESEWCSILVWEGGLTCANSVQFIWDVEVNEHGG